MDFHFRDSDAEVAVSFEAGRDEFVEFIGAEEFEYVVNDFSILDVSSQGWLVLSPGSIDMCETMDEERIADCDDY